MTTAVQTETHPRRTHSTNVLTLVLATACGLSVANIYYAQPLLDLIAHSFHTSQGGAAVVVTATQLGYALGLVLLLPLGDLIENRTLTSRTLIVTTPIAGRLGDAGHGRIASGGFLGGAVASAVSGLLYDHYQWAGPTLFSAILPVVGFILWLGSTLRAKNSSLRAKNSSLRAKNSSLRAKTG